MPSTVADGFAGAGLQAAGAVGWGTPVPLDAPGMYVVALTEDANALVGTLAEAPVDRQALERLLLARPELCVDGAPASTDVLAARLSAFWLPDEVVLYIGLAGTSVRGRVRQYYSTPLGARRPHAGGWWLKTLTVLDDLWVHWADTPVSSNAEEDMLSVFAAAVSPAARAALPDRDRVAPFANLRTAGGAIKDHGITGATGDLNVGKAAAAPPRQSAPGRARASSPPSRMGASRAAASRSGEASSQPVTAKDVDAGRVRFPRAAKRLLPAERAYVQVLVRGAALRARWDPRTGPVRERSGVLAFGRGTLDGLVAVGDVLNVHVSGDGRVVLE